MIVITSYEKKAMWEGIADATLFADTKTEVPQTGTATLAVVQNPVKPDKLPAGSILYTAALEVAVLNSSDEWVWKE